MACSDKQNSPPSPNGEGQDAKRPGWGSLKQPPTSRVSPHFPTLTASPSVPPQKEREDRRIVIKRAREFRKTLTPQEARLWLRLRALRVEGFHFRRQSPFLSFYLDFVCFKRKLVIEVDGGQHNDRVQADHDLMRDSILRRHGFQTLRVSNGDINTNLEGVMETVLRLLSQ